MVMVRACHGSPLVSSASGHGDIMAANAVPVKPVVGFRRRGAILEEISFQISFLDECR